MGYDTEWLVTMLLMLTDAGVLQPDPQTQQFPLEEMLTGAMDILVKVNSHAYMSHQRADRALELITIALRTVTENKGMCSIKDIFSSYTSRNLLQ